MCYALVDLDNLTRGSAHIKDATGRLMCNTKLLMINVKQFVHYINNPVNDPEYYECKEITIERDSISIKHNVDVFEHYIDTIRSKNNESDEQDVDIENSLTESEKVLTDIKIMLDDAKQQMSKIKPKVGDVIDKAIDAGISIDCRTFSLSAMITDFLENASDVRKAGYIAGISVLSTDVRKIALKNNEKINAELITSIVQYYNECYETLSKAKNAFEEHIKVFNKLVKEVNDTRQNKF